MTPAPFKPGDKAMVKPRCTAAIYKRDTYRYSGRGKSGFTMHYKCQQCTHAAKKNGFCGKHQINPLIWDRTLYVRDKL